MTEKYSGYGGHVTATVVNEHYGDLAKRCPGVDDVQQQPKESSRPWGAIAIGVLVGLGVTVIRLASC